MQQQMESGPLVPQYDAFGVCLREGQLLRRPHRAALGDARREGGPLGNSSAGLHAVLQLLSSDAVAFATTLDTLATDAQMLPGCLGGAASEWSLGLLDVKANSLEATCGREATAALICP